MKQFGSKRYMRFKFNWSKLLASKPKVDLSKLENPFTLHEVKRVTFDLDAGKALGPNGFMIFFFQVIGSSSVTTWSNCTRTFLR